MGLWSFLKARWARLLGGRGAKALGKAGEEASAKHLEKLGHRILARNFRVRGGEADLIAEKDGRIVAVEVKTRSTQAFGTPAQAVTPKKARRVLRAGRAYCRAHGISLSKLRCDVVAVEANARGELSLRHFPNAFGDGRIAPR